MNSNRLASLSVFSALMVGCMTATDADLSEETDTDSADRSAITEAAPAVALRANDISVLFPVSDRLMQATDFIAQPTFTDAQAAVNQRLLQDHPVNLNLSTFRVVAMRFDPCFRSSPSSERCVAQMRLVTQPVSRRDGRLVVDDEAIHLFYNLSTRERIEAVARLRALVRVSPLNNTNVVGPNPQLVAEPTGPYQQGLEALVRQYAIPARLNQVALAASANFGQIWKFGAVVVRAYPPGLGFPSPGLLPAHGPSSPPREQSLHNEGEAAFRSQDDFVRSADGRQKFGFTFVFFTDLDPDMQLTTRQPLIRQMNRDQIVAAHGRSAAFESPEQHGAFTSDCASCHVAQVTREFFEDPDAMRAYGHQPIAATRTGLLAPRTDSVFNTNNIRMFGYQFLHGVNNPVVTQRVLNETSESLAILAGR